MARDFEFFNTLMRCLPTKSSELVRREHGDLSTMLPKSPTATELSIGLHNLRHMINKDIQKNGAEPSCNLLKQGIQKGKITRKPYANFGIDKPITPSRSPATYYTNLAAQQGPPTKDPRRTLKDGHNQENKPRKNPSGIIQK